MFFIDRIPSTLERDVPKGLISVGDWYDEKLTLQFIMYSFDACGAENNILSTCGNKLCISVDREPWL